MNSWNRPRVCWLFHEGVLTLPCISVRTVMWFHLRMRLSNILDMTPSKSNTANPTPCEWMTTWCLRYHLTSHGCFGTFNLCQDPIFHSLYYLLAYSWILLSLREKILESVWQTKTPLVWTVSAHRLLCWGLHSFVVHMYRINVHMYRSASERKVN